MPAASHGIVTRLCTNWSCILTCPQSRRGCFLRLMHMFYYLFVLRYPFCPYRNIYAHLLYAISFPLYMTCICFIIILREYFLEVIDVFPCHVPLDLARLLLENLQRLSMPGFSHSRTCSRRQKG
ncbi:hypothetical protein SCHPADRAFT_49091 [Schizopora paradoxa]|uniref:Uncharacterized protein n=1 Tax=Schizopora paradoxa TaxID=27342 RepID=A0A0H2S5V9_9AGAM|nr:hypothetical protein SCHPADRAFT_49091 [Schizopora paradoxa]